MDFQENLDDFENASGGQSNAALLVQRIYARTSNFVSALKEKDFEDDLEYLDARLKELENDVQNYLDFSYVFGDDGILNGAKNPVKIVLNSSSYESINCSSLPELMTESCKSIIVMEFFTHCCINCIHSIEDIRQVYEELTEETKSESAKTVNKCGLKFVSIHSPKFTREKDSESIKAFTKRMKMDYSNVVNDPSCLLWNELGICCWPTLLVFGPNPQNSGPNLIFTLMGEGHKDVLRLFLKCSLKYFEEKFPFGHKLQSSLLEVKRVDQIDSAVSTFLKYPGKVTWHGELLAIADSGNNRIVISASDGFVKHIIGGTSKGYKDGDFESARFYNPQGIAFYDEHVFYVADTGNHAIRKVDLITKAVTTLVPPGWNGMVGEESFILKSPWDLSFHSKDVLLVAAAGNHRIFGYFFETVKLFNVEHVKGSFSVVAGSGREENRNNSYILKACFAQPSGICVSHGTSETEIGIYIADSESSSIRTITNAGKVMGVVGGARDPTDLFAYGDVDGKGFDAKLQHPMGVCWSSSASSIYAVDTYNHKVKVIYLGTKDKDCCTIIGDGISGNQLGGFIGISPSPEDKDDVVFARLNEPSGICCDDKRGLLYIADTNNHIIKVANLSQRTVKEFSLSTTRKKMDSLTNQMSDSNEIFEVTVVPDLKNLSLQILITGIPKHFEGGRWSLHGNQTMEKLSGEVHKDINDDVGKVKIEIPCLNDNKQFQIRVDIFLCGISSCYKKSLKFLINLSHEILNDDAKCSEAKKSPILLKYEPNQGFFLE